MAQYPIDNQPPSPPHTQNCDQTPQEAAAQMNRLLCLQNTWQPPPWKKRRLLWSLINTQANCQLEITIPISRNKKQTSSKQSKSFMAPHMWRGPPYQHINAIILVYPWPIHTPTPIKPPNSELVWPLRILPARPRLTPWAETMATTWE